MSGNDPLPGSSHQHDRRGGLLDGVLPDHRSDTGIEPCEGKSSVELGDTYGRQIESFLGREQALGYRACDIVTMFGHGLSIRPMGGSLYWNSLSHETSG